MRWPNPRHPRSAGPMALGPVETRQTPLECRRTNEGCRSTMEIGIGNVKGFTHLNSQGEANMVDVSHKPVLLREAVARGEILLQKEKVGVIQTQKTPKEKRVRTGATR